MHCMNFGFFLKLIIIILYYLLYFTLMQHYKRSWQNNNPYFCKIHLLCLLTIKGFQCFPKKKCFSLNFGQKIIKTSFSPFSVPLLIFGSGASLKWCSLAAKWG